MNPWIPKAAPDTRLKKDILVNREGLISFNGSQYSINASYIGYIVTLKVNKVNRKAEVWADETLLRSFLLQPKGLSVIDIREEDRKSLLIRWEKENRCEKTPEKVKSDHDQVVANNFHTEVDVRHPSDYDRIVGVSA